MIERLAPVSVPTPPIRQRSGYREVTVTNVQFFRLVLIGLIAATFISGTMMVGLAMTVDPAGYQQGR
jgi:hypothetical protein